MAEKTPAYPMMSTKTWWALRVQFQRSIPKEVTDTYLATVLSMEEASARANALLPMKQAGLVDDQGVPILELVKLWRDDHDYPKACQQIRDAVYPQELRDLFPGPIADIAPVERWFKKNSGVGDSAASKQANFFKLLTDADATKAKGETGPRPAAPPSSGKTSLRKGSAKTTATAVKAVRSSEPPPRDSPALHLNIQIHISAEASPEQIDKIFASMAKHLRGLNSPHASE